MYPLLLSKVKPVFDIYSWIGVVPALIPSLEGEPFGTRWEPPTLSILEEQGRLSPAESDYPPNNAAEPLISLRAWRALRGLLEPHVEVLPTKCAFGEYLVLNVLTVVDALDEAGSDLLRFDDGGVMQINRYSFDPARLTGAPLFKIPQEIRTLLIATPELVDAVRRAKLTGFDFIPLWPTT